ncbi:hypothetical protein CORT_0E02080 [Candida orthopsilosis Co 90-125]|uniref:Uncharacterized protein n=1 Tax=Candida orthopsilosis (strain 90-125) TaxID=1136231 RepID=H8X7L1_CANO9|nr:hypothetical protein CORT_0E02080 [Candida orthopsilosis Co 90-125]CCG23795.1 hypothetical protein CORT_0E02080 [Candida orthopsilosis Co 90-125]
MFSISSSIIGVVIFFLILNAIQFLLWLLRKPIREEQSAPMFSEPHVTHRHSEAISGTSQPRSEVFGSLHTTNQSTTPNDSFANFRARLLAARGSTGSQSDVETSTMLPRRDGKQFKMKFKEVREKAKSRIQTVADKYSKKVQRTGRRSSSVSINSVMDDLSSKAPNFDDEDPPPPYSLH